MTASWLTVSVALAERSYPIQIGSGNLSASGERWRATGRPVTHAVVLADAHVLDPAQIVADSFRAVGAHVDLMVVPAGEASKSIATATELWNQLLARGADRKTVLVAVGGGVMGDLGGFVAATYTRGLRFCQIPTTLLAQVDSSVGGKTGVNLPAAKNMVGVFWQPSLVVIDTDVLSTLPDREYLSGLAEVIKYGVILDAELFAFLERNVDALRARDSGVLRQVVARCCRLKADVVEADERETTGLRAVLNYGHTFAHALEAVSGYGQLLHGEAVAIGMVCASRLAELLGRIPSEVTRRQVDLLQRLQLGTQVPALDHQRLWAAMGHDKKVEHGKLRFVLPSRLGHVELVGDVPQERVLQVLAECS